MSFCLHFLFRFSICSALMVAFSLPTMMAQGLTWDADPGTGAVQDGSGTWVVGGTNWYDGTSNVPWAVDSTDIAVFGAGGTLGSSNRVVTVDGEVSAGGIRFDPIASGSEAYILNGGVINLQDNAVLEIVDGATSSGGNNRIRLNSNVTGNNISILKTGTDGTLLGSMQLHNAKSWTGTLTLEDLTTNPNESLFVEVFSADALNTLDAVHIKSNSVMTVATGNEITTDFILDSLAGRGAIRLDVDNTHLSGTITSNVASTISVNNAGHSARFSGVIDGAASLNLGTVGKAGTYLIDGVIAGPGGITLNEGTVILAGENTSAGAITLNKGEVIVANEGALNTSAPMNVVFNSGTSSKTFTLDGYDTTVGSLIGSGSAINVQNGAATDATLTITGSGISFGGTINDGAGGGKLNLEYRGNSTGSRYAINGANTFTGDVTITQGTLIARSNNNSLGAASLVTVAQGARLELDSNVTITGKHLITPYLVGANGTNTWDGTVQVAAGGTNANFVASSGNTLIIEGEINGTNPDGQLSDITASGDGTVIMNGDIVNARRLVKNGSGTWVLGGNNNFNTESAASLGSDFGLSIFSGTVRLTNENALAEGNGVYNMVTFHSDSGGPTSKTLQIYGVDATVRSLFSGSAATSTIVENGSDTDATLILKNPDNRTYTGVIRDGGDGSLGLTVTSGGIQTLTGENTYTGDTTVSGGAELRLNFAHTISASVPVGLVVVPTDNIINNAANESALNMDSGTLRIQGLADTNNSQRFNGLNVSGGYSTIDLTNAANNTITLSLGDISRSSGYVNFNIGSNIATTTTGNDPTGILGTWATVNGTDWAMNDGLGNIVAFDEYFDVTAFSTGTSPAPDSIDANGPILNDPEKHVRIIDGGASGNVQLANNSAFAINDIASLLQSATSDATVDVPGFETLLFGYATLRLGQEGAIMLADGAGSLTIGSSQDVGSGLTAGGADNVDGTLTFTNFSSTSDIVINSSVRDNGTGVVSVVKNGPGELVLTGLNTYSGGTRINGGVLTITTAPTDTTDFALGAVPSSFDADNIIMDGGRLNFGSLINLDANRGVLLLDGGGSFSGSGAVRGEISGIGSLTKVGSGTLRLFSNTYSGDTYIAGGVIKIEDNQALGTTEGITAVTAGGAYVLVADGITVTGETIRIRGNGNNYGALQLEGGSNAASATEATWAGDVILDSTSTTNVTAARIGVQDNTFGVLTISGVIRDGTGNILNISANGNDVDTAEANGVVLLSNNNIYTGATEITRGTLRLGIDDALPTGTILQMSIAASVTELIAFDLNGFDQTIAGLRSGLSEANQATSPDGNQRIINSGSSASKLTVDQDTDTTYQGSIQGNVELEKAGDGTLTLNSAIAAASGATDYTGKTTVSGGTLALSGAGDLTGTPWIEVLAGANFDVSNRTVGSYTVSNKVLSGTGTFSGTYVVDGSSVIRPGSSASGATAAQAGSGFGTLTFDNLTIAPSATDPRVLMQLGGTNVTVTEFTEMAVLDAVSGVGGSSDGLYDQLVITGDFEIDTGAVIKVDFANDYVAQLGDVFNLIDWVNAQAEFNGFNVNSDLDLSAMEALLENDWFFDTSLFLEHGIIYVVPEPSKALLMCAGLAALFLRRRRAVGRNAPSFATDPI